MRMGDHFDALETRPPQQREQALLAALPAQVLQAQQHSAALGRILAGVQASVVTSRAALSRLPVTRKSELLALQQASRPADPFGGFAAVVRGPRMPRIFASPGPIYEPDVASGDYWRVGRALYAAGFRQGDLVHNAFSYHMTPGAFMMESGAHALGCTVFPAGTGQTEQQLAAIADLRPDGYSGTPSFLRILLDEGVIVEIVRPGTGDPVPDGEVGELVITTLNPHYPLIRFGTGDLSAVLPGRCPSGRTNQRIKGWMGRADQTTKIKGMFVHPGQVAEVAKRFPQVLRARLVVSGEMASDQMTLRVEASEALEGLAERLGEAVRDVTKLRGTIELLAPGSLPNDGKVIEDARSYK
jgi:phenylacetate-CoA ligase